MQCSNHSTSMNLVWKMGFVDLSDEQASCRFANGDLSKGSLTGQEHAQRLSAKGREITNSTDRIHCLPAARMVLHHRDEAVAGGIQDAVSESQLVAFSCDRRWGGGCATANALLVDALVPVISVCLISRCCPHCLLSSHTLSSWPLGNKIHAWDEVSQLLQTRLDKVTAPAPLPGVRHGGSGGGGRGGGGGGEGGR